MPDANEAVAAILPVIFLAGSLGTFVVTAAGFIIKETGRPLAFAAAALEMARTDVVVITLVFEVDESFAFAEMTKAA